MKNWFEKRGLGFTLIELLVVIAIIALLASILTPTITKAMLNAKATQMTANARSLHQMLFAKSLDNAASGTGNSYPGYASTMNLAGGTFQFSKSTEYFIYAITSGVMNVDFTFFGGGGVAANPTPGTNTAAMGSFAQGSFNAWNVTADLNDGSPDTVPLFFTRNLVVDNVRSSIVSSALSASTMSTNKPFGNKAVVFVTKGGAAFKILSDDMSPGKFFNIWTATDESTVTNAVLKP